LPVGPAFSALFAESVLTPIDWELKAQRIEYVRFNDDFRFFCRNEIEAQRALQTLADLLWKVGQFTTQETKTKISSRSDFLERAGSDGWLEKLREVNQQQSYAHADQTRPVNDDLVSAARGVLIQALDPNHVAWIRLSKAAFSALPLREQLTVLPTVLAQLARVWSIAPLVQRSLRDFAASGYDTKMAVRLVVSSLSESQQTPDYAMTWLLHAFQEGDWSHKELLSSLNARLDPSLPIARRELLLALRGLGVAREIKFDPHDPWQARAFQYSTGAPPSTLPLRDKGRRARWDEALTDLITVLSRGQ
jgi:hypothetical protein